MGGVKHMARARLFTLTELWDVLCAATRAGDMYTAEIYADAMAIRMMGGGET